MSEPVYGLVLSGGGARGIAHIGALKALEEYGIQPQYVSGASAGAIVAAFYAGGYSSEETLDFFKKTSLFNVQNYARGKPGFLDTEKFYDILKEYFPEDSYEALEKRLFVSATNIIEGKSKIFHTGELIHTILASAAFPVVLTPVTIDGVLYADGGILNNFPVEPLLTHCDKIVGVYVSPLKEMKPEDFKNSFSLVERAYHLSIANNSLNKLSKCDLIIYPKELSRYSTFNVRHIDEIYRLGYETAKDQLKGYAENIDS